MGPYRTALIVGSLRAQSFNKRLGRALVKLAPESLAFEPLRLDDLPPYNQDQDGDFPPPAQRFKEAVRQVQAVLFVTPEYNRSVPGVLKNAIDWASRPYGDSAWAGKPAAVCGTSPGAIGTAIAQQHLRGTLAYLDMPTLGQPEVFLRFTEGLIDDEDRVTEESTRQFLQGFLQRFAAWVERHAKS